jgi:hypothetical protein
MEREITWQDCIIVIDQLMETLKRKMYEEPQYGEFWQQELAVAMAKKQEICILAKQQEEQQFMQSLEKICSNVLKKSKEQQND